MAQFSLTVSPRSPDFPAGPTGPGAPEGPGAPGAPAAPLSPRSPYNTNRKSDNLVLSTNQDKTSVPQDRSYQTFYSN